MTIAMAVFLLLPGFAIADSVGEPARDAGKPNPLKNVYFGEQHLHSENSPDAFAAGTRQPREDAFRYGRGDEISLLNISNGKGVKIKRGTPYGNLDRIQIIKGYLGGRFDDQQEKVYEVALSDGRKVDPKTGEVPPVGNTVDVTKATFTNDIGDSQLSAVWTDPDFDPSQPAVYYVRVLEIPTPRWTTYDAVKSGLPIPKGIPTTLQERAWSSPI